MSKSQLELLKKKVGINVNLLIGENYLLINFEAHLVVLYLYFLFNSCHLDIMKQPEEENNSAFLFYLQKFRLRIAQHHYEDSPWGKRNTLATYKCQNNSYGAFPQSSPAADSINTLV
jgi:hypothetical protein